MTWFDCLGERVPDVRRRRAVDEAREMGLEPDGRWLRGHIDDISRAIKRDDPERAVGLANKHLDPTGAYRLLAALCVEQGWSDEDRARAVADRPHDSRVAEHHAKAILGRRTELEEHGDHLIRRFDSGGQFPVRCACQGCDLWLAEEDDVARIAESTPCPAKTEMYEHKAGGEDQW